ncbi:MAG: ComF family protein [Elusimicrobia bacterium]|nr:ComF family protein [Elusimicrobiota bacterium]
MIFNFTYIGKYFLHVLLPRTCAHCKEDLRYPDDGPLCPDCRANLEPIPELHCKKCGLPLDSGGGYCFNCRGHKGDGAADFAVSAFVFNPELRALIHEFKYRGRRGLAGPLGLELAKAYDRYPELKPYNFVIPVPLFREKETERGFNQSRLLAEVLGREKKLFVLEDAVERIRNTPSQTRLTKKERHANMEGAFKVTRPELVKGRRVLIIDDVATTLATVSEIAGRLKEAGAAGAAVFTLAREP